MLFCVFFVTLHLKVNNSTFASFSFVEALRFLLRQASLRAER